MEAKDLELIKNLSTYNNSITFHKGHTTVISNKVGSIFVRAKFSNKFITDIPIFDVNKLFKIISASGVSLSFSESFLTIKKKSSNIKYLYADTRVVKRVELHPNLENAEYDVKLSLNSLVLDELIEDGIKLGLEHLKFFSTEDNKLLIKILTITNSGNISNEIDFDTGVKYALPSPIALPLKSINLLKGAYIVSLKLGEKGSHVQFYNTNDIITYWFSSLKF
jgi:hypothetical protein